MARTIESGNPGPQQDAAETTEKFARLDRLVRSLVERHKALLREHEQTTAKLAERDEQIRELNQRRQDAGKRLDEILARLDQLDGDLERRLSLPAVDESSP